MNLIFFHYACHGHSDGELVDEDSPSGKNRIMLSSDISNATDWNNDAEWVWSAACDTLNKAGGGRNAWDDALFGNPRPSHMILGYHELVSANIRSVFDDFFDHAVGSGWDSLETIIGSFYHANTDSSRDEPCAIVTHSDNVDDMLKVVTRDTNSTSMIYYWYDTSGNIWHEEPYTASTKSADKTVWMKSELPAATPYDLTPLTMELRSLKSKPQGFAMIKRAYGLNVFCGKRGRG